MPLAAIAITLIAAGALIWIVNRFVPMDGGISGVINFVIVTTVIIWLLYITGILG